MWCILIIRIFLKWEEAKAKHISRNHGSLHKPGVRYGRDLGLVQMQVSPVPIEPKGAVPAAV